MSLCVPDWRTISTMHGSFGSCHLMMDEVRGLRWVSIVSPSGRQADEYAFKADTQNRAFADEDSMLAAYEKSPGVVCATCGAIATPPQPPEGA